MEITVVYTGVKFDDAKITGWTMVGYPDSDTIVSNNTTFLANYNTNIVEKYVYSYSPDVGSVQTDEHGDSVQTDEQDEATENTEADKEELS